MIDTHSDPGSYAAILPYCTQITITHHDAWLDGLPARLAARKMLRPQRSAAAHKGAATKKRNGSA